MPLSPDDLFALFARLGIPQQTTEHEAVFTVAASQAIHAAIDGAHTKNLFLKDKKGRLFLVTALQDTVIDLKRLHEALGASGRFSFGSADQMMEHLGVTPGSVTAFAVANDTSGNVTMILDERLMAFERINGHPLINTMTTSVTREDMIRFLEAVGHAPRIVMVGEAPV
jgi:Ala-tRNA(Pro) deacylase